MKVSVTAVQQAAEMANRALREFQEGVVALDLPERENPLFAHSLLGASILEVMVKTLGYEGTLHWVHAVLGSLAQNAAALNVAAESGATIVELSDPEEQPS